MPTIIPPFKLSNHQPDGSHALGSNLKQWWHALPIGLGSLIWSGLVATLIILGMLLAFHQVVIDAVQQSELRHQAIALEAEASWRCNTLRGPSAVGSCLAQLKLAAPASAGDQSVFGGAQTGSTWKLTNTAFKRDSTID